MGLLTLRALSYLRALLLRAGVAALLIPRRLWLVLRWRWLGWRRGWCCWRDRQRRLHRELPERRRRLRPQEQEQQHDAQGERPAIHDAWGMLQADWKRLRRILDQARIEERRVGDVGKLYCREEARLES